MRSSSNFFNIAAFFIIFLGSLLPVIDWDIIISTTNEEVLRNYFIGLFSNKEFLTQLINGAIGFGGFLIISILVSIYLGIGQVGMAYESLTGKTRVKTMFKVSKKLGFRWILTILLLSIFGIIALIPLAILTIFTLGLGIFFIISFFVLIAPSMVADNSSPMQSIKNSFNCAKRNYWDLFFLCVIYFVGIVVVSFLGLMFSVIPFIGWLIDIFASLFISFAVIPMIKISFVDYYVKNRKNSNKEI